MENAQYSGTSASSWKPWLVKACLIAFGLTIGVIASEIALDIIKKGPKGSEFSSISDLRKSILTAENAHDSQGSVTLGAIINPHPNDQIIYDLRPKLNVTFQGVPVSTNACGMRNREVQHAKPPHTYRIAFIGDSFTFGWGVNEDEAFPRVLEKNLNIRSKNTKFEVLNFGVPGYSTFQEVAHFIDIGSEFDPDAIVVFFIENDFGLPFFIRDIENPDRLLNSTGLGKLASQALGQEKKAPLPTNFDPNIALAQLADYSSSKGIKLYLAFNPKKKWKDMYKKLWVMRNRKDINLIDLRDNFVEAVEREGIPQEDLTLKHDQHPSKIKHRILADTMTPYFLSIIRK